ncbi:MAG: serine/threonine-protein kinase HipA, partial [Salibacteraceae bacterium]
MNMCYLISLKHSLEENSRAHFMTKRFDRIEHDQQLYIQTFCAMQHYDYNLVNS